jgi:integrase
MGVTVPDDLDPTVLQQLFGDRRLWQERLSKYKRTEANRTVGYQLDRHLEEQRTKQQPATHAEYRAYLKRTLESPVWSEKTAIDTIDEDTVRRHYLWLVSQKFGPDRHNKLLGFFRRFILWLDSSNLLDRLPKNLKLKEHRKKPQHKAVRVFEGVKEVVNGLDSPYRLWALLGLNCGMTEADLGETTWNQIDTKKWILTRRRAKTGDNPNSPTVRYKLWPETTKELKALPHRTGLLFVTKTGQPLYSSRYDEQGTPKIKDLLKLYWNRLAPKPAIPLGKFRSIGATALRANNLYRTFDFHFLADVPPDIASKHYSAENDAAFFEALNWIRQHLGFADKEAS